MKPSTSIGFTSSTREHEQLQEAWRSLNDDLLALVIWPIVTAVPAFLVSFAVAILLALLPTKRVAD
jgi:hypothetical protein